MSTSSLSPVSSLFRQVGLYRPARWAFNKLLYSHATRSAEVAGTRCVFRTPTRTMAEQVESLTGEETILRSFLEQLIPSDVVWDVGAGFGLYSVFASRRLSNVSIFAFEPESRMRKLLTENLARNGGRSTHILSCALGNTDANAILYPSDSPNVGASALVQRADYRLKRRGASIPIRRGDSLTEQGEATAPTILKLDVEGAEALALQGMPKLLRKTTLRALYCEIHPLLLPLFGSSVKQLEELIAGSGFAVTGRHVRGREEHLICLRQP
jgi:FkbM family methyltransferase